MGFSGLLVQDRQPFFIFFLNLVCILLVFYMLHTYLILQILSNLEFLRIDDCFREPCQNQGRCHALTNGFVCQCKPGYQGK